MKKFPTRALCIVHSALNKALMLCAFLVVFTLVGCDNRPDPIDDIYGLATGSENGNGYVDLGLSVCWAPTNIGAHYSCDKGLYFAWGETEPRQPKEEREYTFSTDADVLPLQYDAANAILGGAWRIPTMEEYKELFTCDWEWIKYNKVYGYKVTGPNGNSIFLPAVGYVDEDGSQFYNQRGLYQTSSACNLNFSWSFNFDEEDYDLNEYVGQRVAQAVRAVVNRK